MKLRLGSRGSQLALRQSGSVADRLRAGGHQVEVVKISTRGDRHRDLAFEHIGAPGVFVRELESALSGGRVDLVVHSYKDLPSASAPELTVAAVPERLDAADLLLVRPGALDQAAEGILPLADGARVGTASARRRALVLDLRPDLDVAHLRGNVPTRVDRLRAGGYDAILLAAAGLRRLGEDLDLGGLVDLRLDPAIFVPSPSQGALAVQVRAADRGRDGEIHRAVAALDDPAVRRVVAAERRLQALLEGGCQIAFGAWCRPETGRQLRMDAAYSAGGALRRASGTGDDAIELAERLLPALCSAPRFAAGFARSRR